MDGIKRVTMVDYDHVKEMASFSYLNPKGQQNLIWIHRNTFLTLVYEHTWDHDKWGDPTLFQRDLKEAVIGSIKEDYRAWFDRLANDIMVKRVTG